jgi:hypothetical protein
VGGGTEAGAPEEQGQFGAGKREAAQRVGFGVVEIRAHYEDAFDGLAVGGADCSGYVHEFKRL